MRYFKPKPFLFIASLIVFALYSKNNSLLVKADAVIKDQPSMVVRSANLNSDKVIKVPPKVETRSNQRSNTTIKSQKKVVLNRGGSGLTTLEGNDNVVSYAKKFVGRDYVWGAAGPNAFDCSGFTMYIYSKFGVSLPHSSRSQYGYGEAVRRGSLAPGDLLFFNTYSSISHVGIYIGGGNFVHAANSRTGVTISSLSEGYYSSRFVGAKRIFSQ